MGILHQPRVKPSATHPSMMTPPGPENGSPSTAPLPTAKSNSPSLPPPLPSSDSPPNKESSKQAHKKKGPLKRAGLLVHCITQPFTSRPAPPATPPSSRP